MFARYFATGESSRIGVSSWMYESATFSSASSTPSLLDDLAVIDLAAERRSVVVDRGLEVVDGDGDVVDLGQHHGRSVPRYPGSQVRKDLFRKESFGYPVAAWPTPSTASPTREMRALAHPLRLRLLGLLRVEGPATATTLADIVGESPASRATTCASSTPTTSSRRRPSSPRDGRERWWRARAGIDQLGRRRLPRHARAPGRAHWSAARGVPPLPGRARGLPPRAADWGREGRCAASTATTAPTRRRRA